MSDASTLQLFWWVGLPYLALGIFVVGHVWRWRYDQFGWTSRSTQLQERRLLKWGSPIFHYGTFAAIGGHVLGVLIPECWTRAIGIPENVYRWFSAAAGHARRGARHRRRGRPGRPAPAGSPGAGHHQPGRLRRADPAAGRDPDRHRAHDLRQPARPRLRLPHHRRPLVPGPVHRLPRRARHRHRTGHLPGPRHRRVAHLGRLAVQPPRPRVELPAVVPVAPLHRLPQPRAPPPAEPGTSGRRWRKIGVPY